MELEKNYNPNEIEEKLYEIWEKSGYFKADVNSKKESYTIVIPPPNVTGMLHMGHILNNTIQDILIRWKRMSGYETLWVPGVDHAGIATQNVVERKFAQEGKTKYDFGREKFVEEIWKWKEQYGNTIMKQLRKLGSSCDWSRERFTLDEGLSEAVKEVFIRLYNKGLVYRGEYIINWCPRCETALADDEVDHENLGGHLWEIKYPIKDSDDYLVVATTRPETMLGDTAVAVNPNDKRYVNYIGKMVLLPLTNREIPIIADEYVDMEFGTGVVKITPGHDPNDFEVGLRHNLPIINIMDNNAKMTKNAGIDYEGMDRFEAREKVLADLKEAKLLVSIKDHEHAVGHCYRCHTVIEPKVSKQWFVKMKPLAEKALQVVKEGKIVFYPERWTKVYYNWLENIRDWCISRQIWWGHRIPAYYCNKCGEINVNKNIPDKCSKCGHNEFTQDEDVLDTWFSSWLWPFSTLGWPEKTKDLEKFYPTDTLVTAPEILFFWVARMIMAGLEFMEEIPFKAVYLHGVVRDAKGRKMSKSLGNSPDPLDVIKEYGADALRFSFVFTTPQGQDVFYSNEMAEMGRNFANKIWNASRFLLMNIGDFNEDYFSLNINEIDIIDKWILSKLHKTIDEVNEQLEKFRLNDAAKCIYEFIWGEFCDWYLELSKVKLYGNNEKEKEITKKVLCYILDNSLRLLHPYMPFITEEIWKKLPKSKDTIMLQSYPKSEKIFINEDAEKNINILQKIVGSIRTMKANYNISPAKEIDLYIKADSNIQNIIKNVEVYLNKFIKSKNIIMGENLQKPDKSISLIITGGIELFVPLADLIDIEKEKEKLLKEIERYNSQLEAVKRKLENEKFVNNAPKEVIEKEKNKLVNFQEQLNKLKENYNNL